jgi:hypothetical protein
MNIKAERTESIYQSIYNGKLEDLVNKTKWSNSKREEAQALLNGEGSIALIKVENVYREQTSVIDLNHYRMRTVFAGCVYWTLPEASTPEAQCVVRL